MGQFRWKFKSGKEVTWDGHGRCVCTECEEIYNSVTAFDAHLKYADKEKNGHAVHDNSRLVRNAKGYYVTGLMPQEALDKRKRKA